MSNQKRLSNATTDPMPMVVKKVYRSKEITVETKILKRPTEYIYNDRGRETAVVRIIYSTVTVFPLMDMFAAYVHLTFG